MPVGFGFSAGDFIAALKLVGIVTDALRDSGEASSEYRELLRELHSLETALLLVKRLDGEEIPQSEIISLQQAAAQCQSTIDDFWKKAQKYQPFLGSYYSPSRVKCGWMRVKWALCRKDDLVKFKAKLVGHTESINIILNAIQLYACLSLDSSHEQLMIVGADHKWRSTTESRTITIIRLLG